MRYAHSFVDNETVVEYDSVDEIKIKRNIRYILTLMENPFMFSLSTTEENKAIQRMVSFLKESYPEVLL
jgi:hypothetical protein